jgi:hypothetical protein
MNKQPQEVPLIELLKAVPKTARLIVDSADGISSTVYPVGHLCHEAAEALEIANCDLKEPAQEPVAIVENERKYSGHGYGSVETDDLTIVSLKSMKTFKSGDLLYTHPHQWQGLTDDERIKCYETSGHKQHIRPQDKFAVLELSIAIEQALKEKNT